MTEFLMPSLGSDMEAGTLVEWLKKPGETVHRGDIVAVVETQKGAIEIESFDDGVLENYLVELDTKVPVGTPLAVIRKEGEAPAEKPAPAREPASEPEAKPAPAPPPEPTPAPAPKAAPPVSPPAAGERPRVSPAARKRAVEKGIDPATVSGTGPGGAVVLADIEALQGSGAPAAKAEEPAPKAEKPKGGGFEPSAMRDAIAAAMARSKREIPHYYLSNTVDLTRAETHVAGINADRPPERRVLVAALFIKAVAKALRKYPEFNGHYEDGVFTEAETVHAGMAINIRGGGLVAPAIHDAQDLDLDTLMDKMRDLVERVRAGRFRATELSDPTISISSLGERGVEALYAVIYPPQVAIIGFGVPVVRPWVVDGEVRPCRTVTVTLSADHRVSDGHRGALFLNRIDKLLQEPEKL